MTVSWLITTTLENLIKSLAKYQHPFILSKIFTERYYVPFAALELEKKQYKEPASWELTLYQE